VFTDGVAGSILDLKGNINFGSSGSMYSNPSGLDTGPNNNGVIQLDGTILNGTTINPSFASQGIVNVIANSTLNGTYNTTATLGINSGKTFNIAGSTVNVRQGTVVTHVGSLINNGFLAIANGTLNNSDTLAYSLGGGGSITMAGGSITSTGGGAFSSNNILSGWGNVTAPFTNGGQVRADGSGSPQTMALSSTVNETANAGGGWFAQNKGKLLLPFIAVNAAANYNWGGDPTTLNMVNSIGMSFAGPVTPGNLSIALLSTDRADVPAPAGLLDPIGVWSFNSGTLAFGSASMTFRYNDALAASNSIDPEDLGLLGYNGSSWVVIPTNAIDTTNHLLTTSSGLSAFYQDFAIAEVEEVPEPGTLIMLGSLGLSLSIVWWRRKRADA